MSYKSVIIEAYNLHDDDSKEYTINICNGLQICNYTITVSYKINNCDTLLIENINQKIYGNINHYNITVLSENKNVKSANNCVDLFTLINKINYVKYKDISINDTIKDLNNNIEICIINKKICKYLSNIAPAIPIIVGKTKQKNIIAGTFLCDKDNQIIGMITSNNNENNIEIIPFEIILYLINNYLNISIKSLLFKLSVCDININNKDINALYFNTTSLSLKTNKFINITFYIGDVITKINDLTINIDGMIFDIKLNTFIPLETFVLFNGDKYIKITYIRTDKNIEEIVCVKSINLENNLFCVNITGENKTYKFKNIVFSELSEELIIYCQKNNIILPNNIISNYSTPIIDKKPYKIVIITETNNKNILLQLQNNKIEQNKFYFVLIKYNDHYVKHLSDIYNKNIKTLTLQNINNITLQV